MQKETYSEVVKVYCTQAQMAALNELSFIQGVPVSTLLRREIERLLAQAQEVAR